MWEIKRSRTQKVCFNQWFQFMAAGRKQVCPLTQIHLSADVCVEHERPRGFGSWTVVHLTTWTWCDTCCRNVYLWFALTPPYSQINKACSESVNFHFIRRLRVITSLFLSVRACKSRAAENWWVCQAAALKTDLWGSNVSDRSVPALWVGVCVGQPRGRQHDQITTSCVCPHGYRCVKGA